LRKDLLTLTVGLCLTKLNHHLKEFHSLFNFPSIYLIYLLVKCF
jgi:hypothetical protein